MSVPTSCNVQYWHNNRPVCSAEPEEPGRDGARRPTDPCRVEIIDGDFRDGGAVLKVTIGPESLKGVFLPEARNAVAGLNRLSSEINGNSMWIEASMDDGGVEDGVSKKVGAAFGRTTMSTDKGTFRCDGPYVNHAD